MSRGLQTLSYITAHLAAAMVCGSIIIGASLAAVLVLIVQSNDPGGPLFLPIFILMLVAAAIATAVALSVVTALFDLIHSQWGAPLWVPPLVIFCTIGMPFAVLGASARAAINGLILTLLVTAAFFLYWLLVSFVSRLLRRLARPTDCSNWAGPEGVRTEAGTVPADSSSR